MSNAESGKGSAEKAPRDKKTARLSLEERIQTRADQLVADATTDLMKGYSRASLSKLFETAKSPANIALVVAAAVRRTLGRTIPLLMVQTMMDDANVILNSSERKERRDAMMLAARAVALAEIDLSEAKNETTKVKRSLALQEKEAAFRRAVERARIAIIADEVYADLGAKAKSIKIGATSPENLIDAARRGMRQETQTLLKEEILDPKTSPERRAEALDELLKLAGDDAIGKALYDEVKAQADSLGDRVERAIGQIVELDLEAASPRDRVRTILATLSSEERERVVAKLRPEWPSHGDLAAAVNLSLNVEEGIEGAVAKGREIGGTLARGAVQAGTTLVEGARTLAGLFRRR